MASPPKKRRRLERVATVKLPPGRLARAWAQLRSAPVMGRLGFAVAAALAMLLVSGAWRPPFRFRTGETPARDVAARVAFKVPAPEQTKEARDLAARQARAVYRQDPEPLAQVRGALNNAVVQIIDAATFRELDADLWRQFQPPDDGEAPMSGEQKEETFESFRAALSGEEGLSGFQKAIEEVLGPYERHGLLEKLAHEEGNQREIFVYPVGQPDRREIVPVEDVLIGVQTSDDSPLLARLKEDPQTRPIAERLFAWLRHRLTPTLTFDPAETEQQRDRAAQAVPEVYVEYQAGQRLASAGQPLGPNEMKLLHLEHDTALADPALRRRWLPRLLSMAALIGGLFAFAGSYVVSRAPALVNDWKNYASILALVVTALGIARLVSADAWRAEIIPLLLFAMIVAIAFHRQLALLLAVALSTLAVLALGLSVADLLVLLGVTTAAVLPLTRIRSRIKLIRVCCVAALVAVPLKIVLETLTGEPLEWNLLVDAARLGFWTVCSGFLITGLLPFIEKHFDVLTDLSLLELGDVSHPLLQELVRRAPGTYNHSINVASLGEAAAESIGVRGLLVRVGAYFHDIGKMLKPQYFAENQGEEGNRHEALQPAMSTLVIIAHVKDGADLARSHHLPRPIIDFIEQHHGTTLVEFFYHRANQQQMQEAPQSGALDEGAFRYPGPKPQTKEAAVMMLADAVESACRSLSEPAPARIESLVEKIAAARLNDGQFDESGINLQELRRVQDSLIKSLIAVYHGRVKYPDQRTA